MTLDNLVMYRIETLCANFNLVRLYHLWWLFLEWMVSDLPMRHTISSITSVAFGSMFAIKRAMNSWNAVNYIMPGWAVRDTHCSCCPSQKFLLDSRL